MTERVAWDLVAAASFAVFYVISFPLRAAQVRRRTGETPRLPRSGRWGWLGYTLVDLSLVLTFVGPLLAAGDLFRLHVLDQRAFRLGGASTYAAGFALCRVAQARLGDSWRAGVRPAEQTPLITAGPFARVRNPFFSGWLLVALGMGVLAPNVVSASGFVVLVVALHVLVLGVEEPHLRRIHGAAYESYRAATGRFLPSRRPRM